MESTPLIEICDAHIPTWSVRLLFQWWMALQRARIIGVYISHELREEQSSSRLHPTKLELGSPVSPLDRVGDEPRQGEACPHPVLAMAFPRCRAFNLSVEAVNGQLPRLPFEFEPPGAF